MAKRILIADDIKFVRDTIAKIATEAHFQVVGEAKDGKEAVQMYMQFRPDIVTMDIVMPEMSGIEATRAIVKRDHDARVVIVSAMDQEQLIMEAINAGAKDFVVKPFSAADLLKTLVHVLSGGEKSRAAR